MSDEHIVECQGGKVRAVISKPNHPSATSVYNYYAISFAEPPTGKRRFMPPEPLSSKWKGILHAKAPRNTPVVPEEIFPFSKVCLYVATAEPNQTSEDCLNLNVSTPTTNADAKLPVMVWLYGGGFEFGTNATYNGSALAGMNNTVVVIPNYRLNAIGFLNVEGCNAPNAGLMDQVEALRWVRDNIASFGGDPNNVTIFGESAGGWSVAYHMVSPLSKGLFHKAICESGAIPISRGFASKEANTSNLEFLLKELGISCNDKKAAFEKLQDMDTTKLMNAVQKLADLKKTFLPMIDGKFLTKHPRSLFSEKNFHKVPVMLGWNSSDGVGVVGSYFCPEMTEIANEEAVVNGIKSLLSTLDVKKDDPVRAAVMNRYKNKEKASDKFLWNKVIGYAVQDSFFVEPTMTMAKATSDQIATYLYYGDFQLRLYHDQKFMGEMLPKHEIVCCDHTDEIPLFQGMPFLEMGIENNPKFNEKEKQLSIALMKMITNFARTGNPNGEEDPSKWEAYTTSNQRMMRFGTDKIEMIEVPQVHDEVKFWEELEVTVSEEANEEAQEH